MSTTLTPSAIRPDPLRIALATLVLGLAMLAAAVPAGAREPAHGQAAAPTGPTGAVSPTNEAPVDSRSEALRAGGRRAPGGSGRTVVRHGIDVSHWQGRIDWRRVARSGRVQFVIAKATEGRWMVDPTYRRNRRMAQRSGVLFTAYHFANPGPERGDARREADWFLRHADLDGRNLLPALDLEDDGGLTPAQLERWVMRWMRRVERRLGVRPMVYTSPGFWSGRVGDTPDVARAGFTALWLSHWGVRRPWVPGDRWDGEGWSFWQWTEEGRVPGIDGPVDRDVYSGPRLEHITIGALRRDDGDDDPRGGRPPRPRPRRGAA